MNLQANSELSTGCESFVPAREQSFASVVRKDRQRQGDWVGKTEWLFSERPALEGDEPGEWVIELRTAKGSRGIVHSWHVMQSYSVNGVGYMRSTFGDFSHREHATGGATRATSKAIAEAHTIAVQQIERIAAAAVAFYSAKRKD
jgi:hypothetical protein